MDADSGVIRITKKTVKFGDEVYQFRNITGFGISVETHSNNRTVPGLFLLALFVLGFAVAIFFNYAFWGLLILAVAIWAILSTNTTTKEYKLALYFNSGETRKFATEDVKFLKDVVEKLYHFMDSDEDGAYIVNLTDHSVNYDNSVHVGGNADGNIVTGIVGRDVSS